jgi:hypothetical protein
MRDHFFTGKPQLKHEKKGTYHDLEKRELIGAGNN